MRDKARIKPFMKWLTKEWENAPDYRFGQLLVNLGIVEDGIKTWNMEISDYPIPHEVMRELQTWGTYGKNGLGEFRLVKISELDTEHIKNILKTQKHIKKTKIEKILKAELKFRNKKRKLNGERKT